MRRAQERTSMTNYSRILGCSGLLPGVALAQMSMGHRSYSTTMEHCTGVPADLQKQAAEPL
jgi:hypothetical protein